MIDATEPLWLARQRDTLLDFYQPRVALPGAGFGWLDASGGPVPGQGSQLWIGARMLHVFALAEMLGRPGAGDLVDHGLDFYAGGQGQDAEFGGWYATVGGENPSDRKELYGQAHVLLAGSSALQAGHPRAETLVSDALELIESRYWVEADGACVEEYDRRFTRCEDYRGQNANMHLTEALLACYEATGLRTCLERATRIAARIAGPAAEDRQGSWRLVEHFGPDWRPNRDFNIDDQRHPFRPYGSQPGHWLEWAKLLLQLRGLGVEEDWLLAAARNLFAGAIEDGWTSDGGFVYTVGWDGRPVVAERFFWEPAEGIGAAWALFLATGEDSYRAWYQRLWEFCATRLRDPDTGSWFHELSPQGHPTSITWSGRPDLYHAFQATLYALAPAGQGLAAAAPRMASVVSAGGGIDQRLD